jgi:homoserine acetyltransferase
LDHLEKPCRPDQLRDVFAHYGKTNRVPNLWMYSLNDRLWGTQYPKQWFDAFHQAGGKGEFVQLPADKNNGHYIFVRNAEAWHPAFEAFIKKLGF